MYFIGTATGSRHLRNFCYIRNILLQRAGSVVNRSKNDDPGADVTMRRCLTLAGTTALWIVLFIAISVVGPAAATAAAPNPAADDTATATPVDDLQRSYRIDHYWKSRKAVKQNHFSIDSILFLFC